MAGLTLKGRRVADDDPGLWLRLGINLDSLYANRIHNSSGDVYEDSERKVAGASSDPDDPGRPPLWGSMITSADESDRATSGSEQRNDMIGTSEVTEFEEKVDKQIQSQWHKSLGTAPVLYPVRPCCTVDYNLVKRWLGTCENFHTCWSQAKNDWVITIMVVDCFEMRLVPIETSNKYFALSYVWGQTSGLELTQANFNALCTPGGLERRVDEIPHTVHDAMKFVREVGARYLWVDCLCIVQDGAFKSSAINNMDIVYRRAWAVIIAGTGENAHAGLPGVGPGSRPQFDVRKSSAVKISEETLAGTVYETRAWTCQERLFARRQIVFLNDYLLFHCPEAIFRDDVHAHTTASLIDVRALRKFETGMTIKDFQEPRIAYQNIVHTYCRRKLRKDEDILRAFVGISNFLGELMSTRLMFGLPEDVLVDALCWRFDNHNVISNTRRFGFPSWSWCGWKSGVCMPRLTKPMHDIKKSSPLYRAVEFSVISGDHELKLQTIRAKFQLDGIGGDRQSKSSFIEYSILDDDGQICGQVQLPSDAQINPRTWEQFIVLKDSAQLDTLSSKSVREASKYNTTPLVLGNGDTFALDSFEEAMFTSRPFLIVMMVQKREAGGWERAGIGYVYRKAIFRSCEWSFDDNFLLF